MFPLNIKKKKKKKKNKKNSTLCNNKHDKEFELILYSTEFNTTIRRQNSKAAMACDLHPSRASLNVGLKVNIGSSFRLKFQFLYINGIIPKGCEIIANNMLKSKNQRTCKGKSEVII